MHKARVCPTSFGETFALFVLNYWLREFPLSAAANGSGLRCQSNATVAIVLQSALVSSTVSYKNVQKVVLDPDSVID